MPSTYFDISYTHLKYHQFLINLNFKQIVPKDHSSIRIMLNNPDSQPINLKVI